MDGHYNIGIVPSADAVKNDPLHGRYIEERLVVPGLPGFTNLRVYLDGIMPHGGIMSGVGQGPRTEPADRNYPKDAEPERRVPRYDATDAAPEVERTENAYGDKTSAPEPVILHIHPNDVDTTRKGGRRILRAAITREIFESIVESSRPGQAIDIVIHAEGHFAAVELRADMAEKRLADLMSTVERGSMAAEGLRYSLDRWRMERDR